MKENLSMEQSQKMGQRLSPHQVKFVQLLEMSGTEVLDEVRTQLEDNPALEKVDESAPEVAEGANDEGEYAMMVKETPDTDPEDDPADYVPQGSSWRDSATAAPQYADDGADMYTYLENQLGQLDISPELDLVCRYIIGNIDENGYLTRSLSSMTDDLAFNYGIDISLERMREAFKVVRSLDPPGICAVDLRDCLLLQLQRIRPTTLPLKVAREIIEDNFDLFSKKHYDRLQSQLGINDPELMREAIDIILRLNPKPGSAVGGSASETRRNHITPDVAVEMADNGRFTVSLVSALPALQVERSFTADIPESGPEASESIRERNRQAYAFIKSKRDEAEAFISALKQRSNTLIAVTEAIVRLQADFFRTGDTAKLHPMILKDVAELTGLDLSVISRATMNKYVATASGTYPLKMFFSEAPSEDSDTSSHEIQGKIKEIIEHEDFKHPLSDEAIREKLVAMGYDIARRTVAKYREKLGIPVGRLRKRI